MRGRNKPTIDAASASAVLPKHSETIRPCSLIVARTTLALVLANLASSLERDTLLSQMISSCSLRQLRMDGALLPKSMMVRAVETV